MDFIFGIFSTTTFESLPATIKNTNQGRRYTQEIANAGQAVRDAEENFKNIKSAADAWGKEELKHNAADKKHTELLVEEKKNRAVADAAEARRNRQGGGRRRRRSRRRRKRKTRRCRRR